MFLYSAARRLLHFLLENTAKTDAKTKRKFNFGRAKCQNSSFSTCQQRNRTTPRGGRRTCCQQQQQCVVFCCLQCSQANHKPLKVELRPKPNAVS